MGLIKIKEIKSKLLDLYKNSWKTDNKLCQYHFWMAKSTLFKTTLTVLGDPRLLCMSVCTLCKRSSTSRARKQKVSKENGMNAC